MTSHVKEYLAEGGNWGIMVRAGSRFMVIDREGSEAFRFVIVGASPAARTAVVEVTRSELREIAAALRGGNGCALDRLDLLPYPSYYWIRARDTQGACAGITLAPEQAAELADAIDRVFGPSEVVTEFDGFRVTSGPQRTVVEFNGYDPTPELGGDFAFGYVELSAEGRAALAEAVQDTAAPRVHRIAAFAVPFTALVISAEQVAAVRQRVVIRSENAPTLILSPEEAERFAAALTAGQEGR